MPEPVTWTVSAAKALKRLEGRLFATVTECAAIFHYDPRTIRKLIDAGAIPSVRHGATRRIPVVWITEQVQAGSQAPAAPRTKPARYRIPKTARSSARRPAKAAPKVDDYDYDFGLEDRKAKREARLTRARSDGAA